MTISLAKIKEEFSKYQSIADDNAIDMILASVIGNLLLGRDPIWLMLVAPPSAGKTTLINPCSGLKSCKFIYDMTEKTLLSGYKLKGKDMSLLTSMTLSGKKIMVFPDFSSLLSKNPVQAGEILAQMRSLYDGRLEKATGTGEVSFHGRMGFLAASTPSIYRFLEGGKALGERFLYYWMQSATPEEIQKKKSDNLVSRLSAKDIENAMAPLYKEYMESVAEFMQSVGLPEFNPTDEQKKRVYMAADFAVKGKAQIRVDFKSGKPSDIPEVAGIGRDLETYYTLLQTLQLMDAHEANDKGVAVSDARVELIEKCAYSSINRTRRRIMEILVAPEKIGATGTLTGIQMAYPPVALTPKEIGAVTGIGLEADMVKSYLYPLHSVQLIQKTVKGNADAYRIREGAVRNFIMRVSKHTQEIIPENFDTVEEKKISDDDWDEESRRSNGVF